MARLTDIFSDDSSSSEDSSLTNSLIGDASSTVGLDATNSNSSSSTDEDGDMSESSSEQTLGLDTSTDGLLGSITDAFSSSDQTTDN